MCIKITHNNAITLITWIPIRVTRQKYDYTYFENSADSEAVASAPAPETYKSSSNKPVPYLMAIAHGENVQIINVNPVLRH